MAGSRISHEVQVSDSAMFMRVKAARSAAFLIWVPIPMELFAFAGAVNAHCNSGDGREILFRERDEDSGVRRREDSKSADEEARHRQEGGSPHFSSRTALAYSSVDLCNSRATSSG